MRESLSFSLKTLGLVVSLLGGWGHQALAKSQSLQMDIGQAFYATEIPRTDIAQRYSQLAISHHFENDFRSYQFFRWDATAMIPMSDGADQGLAVRELYWRKSNSSKTLSLTVGRSLQVWSELDDYFKLGIWQPLARWDVVNPITMGLTGAFFNLRGHVGQLTVFVTGVHLPDQMASYETVDGEITSSNRWFRAPVSELQIEEGTSKIHYDVIEPEVRDVVYQNGFALRGDWGTAERWFARASYANKPANQFHLGINTFSALQVEQLEIVNPKIHPVSARHQVFSTEGGWRTRDWQILLSWTQEIYEDPDIDPNWEQTELIDSQYMGAVIQLGGISKLPRTTFDIGYVARLEDDAESSNTHIKGEVDASTERLDFEDLWAVGISTDWYQKANRRLSTRLRYTVSPEDEGEWLSVLLSYSPERQWTWRLGADIFGVKESAPHTSSFISNYRANDRISGGVTYVF